MALKNEYLLAWLNAVLDGRDVGPGQRPFNSATNPAVRLYPSSIDDEADFVAAAFGASRPSEIGVEVWDIQSLHLANAVPDYGSVSDWWFLVHRIGHGYELYETRTGMPPAFLEFKLVAGLHFDDESQLLGVIE